MISTYQQVCPVIFGTGSIDNLVEQLKEREIKRAFCIYDKGVQASGIAEKIEENMRNAGILTDSFNGVLPDAPDTMIQEAGELARRFDAEAVIGIGGGSSLDTAKAVSVLVDNPLPIESYYASKGGAFQVKSLLILIPTAAGTGSESTVMSVIHDQKTDVKEAVLRPADLTIIDPALTLSVPPKVTAATGFDALSHAIESYTSNNENPKADILSLAAMKIISENLEKAYEHGNAIEYREKMSFASNIAGMAFSDASVHFGHAAAHEFGTRFHMPHGIACAVTLPEVIVYAADTAPQKAIRIAESLGIDLSEDVDSALAAKLAAEKVRNKMRNMQIPSLKDQGISREQAIDCAKAAVEKNWFIICAPSPIGVEEMKELIAKMYDNYQ